MLVVDAISQHWQHIFPGRVLVVPYEKIVMDLEGTARDMLTHCGLPWDDRVLHFHENLRTVQTASLAQVHYQMKCIAPCFFAVSADVGMTAKVAAPCASLLPWLTARAS